MTAALEKDDVFKQTTGLNQWWSCYHKKKKKMVKNYF